MEDFFETDLPFLLFFLQICRSESAIKFVDLILYYQLILLRFQNCKFHYRPVGRAVTRSSLELEVRGSNLGLVKSNTVLPTGAMTRRWAPANSLHASA